MKSCQELVFFHHTCLAGRPATYSDEAILMMLILREVYKCSLRSLQGFMQSLFQIMNLHLPVPSYSQISRRAKTLYKRVNRLTQGKKACHIIFDSTGLKVHGEGEWKVRVHGTSKRRTWRKLHIGIDAETQDIICCELTGNNKGDAEIAEQMLGKLPCKVKSARVTELMMLVGFGRRFMKREEFVLCLHQEMQHIRARTRVGKKRGMMLLQQFMDLVEMTEEASLENVFRLPRKIVSRNSYV